MPICPPENLGFGKVLTDHMLKIKWSNAHGWHAPEITPAAPIPLHPFSHVFHYAQEVRFVRILVAVVGRTNALFRERL